MKPTTKQKLNRNGVVLHEGTDTVVIATGLTTKSANDKTGDMVQVWILHRNISPLAAVRTGRDNRICGDCKHRGVRRMLANGRYKVIGRRCYVQVDKAPSGIWKCYRRNGYRKADVSEYSSLFAGRKVRFGAYGDPAYMPLAIVEAIAAVAAGWTGYTHQWLDAAHHGLSSYVMASVDGDETAPEGWRYFRCRSASDLAMLPGEIRCPASSEGGKRTTCTDCRLCDGSKGETDRRKSIVILDHSAIKNSQPLFQIIAAA